MQVYKNIESVNKQNLFVTAGVFDGLHLGHQHIIKQLINSAKKNNTESALITFWPHPLTIVLPDRSVSLIDTLDEKIKFIETQGVDNLIILPFTTEFSSLSAQEFIKTHLKDKLNISGLIVGYDHKFGRDKLNDLNILCQYAKQYNFKIKKTDAFSFQNETLSSTLIRQAILNGQIERANTFLSRHFSLSGTVVKGYKIGRKLGFPTANIQVNASYKIIPKEGVYAVIAQFDNRRLKGMLNIGTRPTFNNNANVKSIELHLFDFEENIYGKTIKISFCKRMRNEMKFDNTQDLIAQLKDDEKTIKKYFQEKDIR